MKTMYQWISWHQPTDDIRPMAYPPNAAILGWWDTGESGDGAATLCALVMAPDEQAAKTAVLEDWPEAERWRFCVPRDTTDTGDRFPPTKWMLERMR